MQNSVKRSVDTVERRVFADVILTPTNAIDVSYAFTGGPLIRIILNGVISASLNALG